ncbi:MAG: rane protein [Candidatus Sumerlaeota bacterium]|nr:rane protein [Candidatus Sumerlaeota bacterium]
MSTKKPNGTLAATTERLKGMQAFLAEKDPTEITRRAPRTGLYFLRFLYILGRESRADQIWQRAAALTYTTILTLFPLLILLTSMGSLFYTKDQETQLIDFVEKRLLPPPDAGMLSPMQLQERDERLDEIQTITSSIREMSEKYRVSAPRVGFLGFLALLITGYILYQSIESAFEAAWGETRRKASLRRSVTGFTFLLVFAPVIIGASVTASSFLVSILGEEASTTSSVAESAETGAAPSEAGSTLPGEPGSSAPLAPNAAAASGDTAATPTLYRGQISVSGATPTTDSQSGNFSFQSRSKRIIGILLSFLPFLLNSLLLALAYVMIPRTQVKFRYALLGGLTAGLLWELAKVGFFYYIYLSAARRQMIRTLGAVPIFLVWIYFTWIVFLLGNHLVYVSQNLGRLYRQYFGNRPRTLLDGHIFVTVALIVGDAFIRGEKGVAQEDLALKIKMPFSQLEEVVRLLREQGTLTMTEEGSLILARPPGHIAVRDLLGLGCDVRQICAADEWHRRPNVGAAVEQMVGRRDRRLRTKSLGDLLAATRDESMSGSQVAIERLTAPEAAEETKTVEASENGETTSGR